MFLACFSRLVSLVAKNTFPGLNSHLSGVVFYSDPPEILKRCQCSWKKCWREAKGINYSTSDFKKDLNSKAIT